MSVEKFNPFENHGHPVSLEDVPIIRIKDTELTNPRITIAIPTFNRGSMLAETIESVRNQDFSEMFEILVVDNNPDRYDTTEKIMSQYDDARISYHKNTSNIGLFGNWNRLYQLAKGEWVVMIHDDDLLCINFLKDITPYMLPDVDMIGSMRFYPFHKFDKTLLDTTHDPSRAYRLTIFDMWRGSGLVIAGLTIRKKTLLDAGGFDTNIQNADSVLITYFASKYGVVGLDKKIAPYRIAENDSLRTNVALRCIESERYRTYPIIRKFLPPFIARRVQRAVTKSLENSWRTQFNMEFESELYPEPDTKFSKLIDKIFLKGAIIINRCIHPRKCINVKQQVHA